MEEKKTEEGKATLELLLTKDQLHDLWFQTHSLKMGPPDEDGYYRLVLEPDKRV